MLGSPYIKPLEQEAREWSARLQMIQEILDEWLKVLLKLNLKKFVYAVLKWILK